MARKNGPPHTSPPPKNKQTKRKSASRPRRMPIEAPPPDSPFSPPYFAFALSLRAHPDKPISPLLYWTTPHAAPLPLNAYTYIQSIHTVAPLHPPPTVNHPPPSDPLPLPLPPPSLLLLLLLMLLPPRLSPRRHRRRPRRRVPSRRASTVVHGRECGSTPC